MKQPKQATRNSIPSDNLSYGNLYSVDTFMISDRKTK